MDMVKMGRFLAELRKEHHFTQAELGEKLGVTNKTISRWETGNYMPPVEMLEQLSTLYDLSINELLCGKKLTAEEYKDMAETTIKETLQESAFTIKEKQAYLVGGIGGFIGLTIYAFFYNRMMAYVETCIYGGKWNRPCDSDR